MSGLHQRLTRLKRLVDTSAASRHGCHRCSGAPLVLYDDEPENTAPYGPDGYCEACGFTPRVRELAVAKTEIGKLFAELTFSADPLMRKLEKSLLRIALARRDGEDAHRLAVRLLEPADNGGSGLENDGHVDPQ